MSGNAMKLVVVGAAGRMGQTLIRTIHALEGAEVFAAVEREAFERAVSEPEPTYTVDFRVFGTAAQLDELRVYMRTKGIRYGRVPQE